MPPPRVPISKKLVLINSASSVVTRILNITVLLWAIQYLVRQVPAEEYALLAILMPLMLLVPPLHMLLAGGLSRYVTAAYAVGDDRRITQLTSTMFPICLAAGIALGALGLAAAFFIDRLLAIPVGLVPDARVMVAVLMCSAALTFPAAPFTVGLLVRQKFVLANLLQTGGTLLQIVLILVLLLGLGPEVKWVVFAQVIGNVSNLTSRVLISRRLLPSLRFVPGKIDWKVSREVMSFNGWQSLFGFAGLIRDAADPWILYAFANPVAVTAFHLGGIVDRQIRRMSSVASAPLNPVLTAMHSLDQSHRLQNVFLRGGRIGLWVVMAPAVLLAVFRNEFYSLYLGETFGTYRECTVVLLLLLATYPSYYSRWMLHKIALATSRIRPVALATVSMYLVNLVVTLVVVGLFGLEAIGAAAATFAVCTLYDLGLFFPLSIKELRLSARRLMQEAVLPGLAPAVVAGITCESLRHGIEPQSYLALALCAALGCVVYLATLLSFCLLPADRRDLSRIRMKLRLATGLDPAQ